MDDSGVVVVVPAKRKPALLQRRDALSRSTMKRTLIQMERLEWKARVEEDRVKRATPPPPTVDVVLDEVSSSFGESSKPATSRPRALLPTNILVELGLVGCAVIGSGMATALVCWN